MLSFHCNASFLEKKFIQPLRSGKKNQLKHRYKSHQTTQKRLNDRDACKFLHSKKEIHVHLDKINQISFASEILQSFWNSPHGACSAYYGLKCALTKYKMCTVQSAYCFEASIKKCRLALLQRCLDLRFDDKDVRLHKKSCIN